MTKFVLFSALSCVLVACSSKPEPSSSLAEFYNDDVEMAGDVDAGPQVARTNEDSPTYTIDWPVDRARLTQKFHPFTRRPHMGIDLAGPRGSHILAAHYGTVVYTGRDFHGYGRLVIIELNDKLATFYSHLQKILVREGQLVERGQLIGLMGRSGNAHGVHLHFEVRSNRAPVDPLQYLPGGQNI